MNNRSLTIKSIIAALVAIFALVGIQIGADQLNDVLETVLKLVAGLTLIVAELLAWYGRVRKKDVGIFGKRKLTPPPPMKPGSNESTPVE